MQLILLTQPSGTDPDPNDAGFRVIEVPDDGDLDIFLQVASAETQIPIESLRVDFEGQQVGGVPLTTKLMSFGICDGASLDISARVQQQQLLHIPSQSQQSSLSSSAVGQGQPAINPNDVSIYTLPDHILHSPDQLMALCQQSARLLEQLKSHDPELALHLEARDLTKLRGVMMMRAMKGLSVRYTHQQDMKALEKDPDNPELQKKLEEKNRLENIQENYIQAYQDFPEAFGHIHMLYVRVEINGHKIKAFVDSGAQSTIMSKSLAERLGLTRLIDVRYKGQAKGVGTANILGRIHMAQMKFGSTFFPVSLTVLENDGVDFLFGLDTLKRNRCCIDLVKNVLRIEGANGAEEAPFLGESELPGSEIFQEQEMVVDDSSSSSSSADSGLNTKASGL